MKSLKILFKTYCLLILVFFIFRVLLVFTNLDKIDDATFGEIFHAFLIGWQFDTTTASFMLLLPALILIVCELIGKISAFLRIFVICFMSVLSSLAFFVCGADIPYYNEFITRFNISALNNIKLGQTGTVVKMILGEPKFIVYIIPVIILLAVFVWVIIKIFNKSKSFKKGGYLYKSIGSVIIVVLLFFGMRGRVNLNDTPLSLNDSFFCSNNFLNQLGLNPNYVLLISAMEDVNNDYFTNVNPEEAIAEVQRQLWDGVTFEPSDDDYPLSRKVVSKKPANNYNVVVVLMESMKTNNLAHGGNRKNLTPVLDSLCDKSLYFNNFYAQNTRTCYGIFSTLMAYPSMYPGNPMYGAPLRKYESMPAVLKENGYSTAAIIPHDKQFDNIYGFYIANDVETVVSDEDYPENEIINSWGIPDHILFDHSIELMDELYSKHKPFFINILTVSNHAPFVLPEGYNSPHPNYDDELQLIEYADFSIGYFIDKVSEKPWFDNTIFVFLGDHGKNCSTKYPISIDFVHVPLIVYAPNIIEPCESYQMASQIDVFPTIMGLLDISYNNSTFGIDLMKQNRKYAYFMNGNKYGIIDDEWYYLSDLQGNSLGLYHYRDNDNTNYEESEKEKATEMKFYGESNWKTMLILNGNRTEVSSFLR